MRRLTVPRIALAAAAAGVVIASTGPSARAQLRVVSMNASNADSNPPGPRNPWMTTILSAIGSTVSDDPTISGNSGIAKPIDVLALQEVDTPAATSGAYASLLNSMYPGANYQYSTVSGTTTGAGTQGLVYNANAVQLIATTTVGTSSSAGQPRQALRYQLRPVGYESAADVYVYNSHYKSSTADEDRRLVEAQAIRLNSNALGPNKNIIYLGDFNVYHSDEPMYQELLEAGNGKANDPINKPGNWSDNSAFKNIHTQSPFNSTTATGLNTGFNGTAGGMDDRFDQQLISNSMIDGHVVAYIPNSYNAFGNNGTHALNSPINSAGNTFPGPRNSALLDAMAGILDHLPVVADYTIPAKMGATVTGGIPSQVITGGTVTVTLNVSNAAPVSFTNGADSLSYSYSSTGAASGSGSGTDAALGGTNNHTITLNTSGTGAKSGSITATSTSEAAATAAFNQSVDYTVLGHADGSFSPSSSGVTGQTIDFGYVPVGSSARTAPFSINNVAGPGSAALDLDSIVNAGGTAQLSTNASTFANLAAGSGVSFTASLAPNVAGNFAATHTFALSDQNLPGAAARPSLVLNTTARVFSTATFPVTGYMYLPTSYTAGSFSIQSGVTLTKTGPGNLVINGTHNNGPGSHLVLAGGTTTFNTDAGGPGGAKTLAVTIGPGASVNFAATQHLASLSIDNGGAAAVPGGPEKFLLLDQLAITDGTLDLRDNDLILDYTGASPIADIEALVRSAYNVTGDWLGDGITSSIAAADGNFGIAIADNAQLPGPFGTAQGGPTFFGHDVDLTTILVKFTHRSDINLDGLITPDDAAIFGGNYSEGEIANRAMGDMNYDGVFTPDDAALFGAYYDESLMSMPEPAGLGVLGFASWLVVSRRARKSRAVLAFPA